MSEPRTPEATKQALEDLVRTDGWQIVKELVEQHFGADAQLRQIDDAMERLQPGDDQLAVVTQIRAAAKAATTVIALAEDMLRAVQQAAKPTIIDRFAALRRV